MAVFAPMPSASVSTAIAVNAGLLRNARTLQRMSWISIRALFFVLCSLFFVLCARAFQVFDLWSLPIRNPKSAILSIPTFSFLLFTFYLLLAQRHERLDLRG